jgi:hypothetical protein
MFVVKHQYSNMSTFLAHLAKGIVSFCFKIGQSETRIACGGHVC